MRRFGRTRRDYSPDGDPKLVQALSTLEELDKEFDTTMDRMAGCVMRMSMLLSQLGLENEAAYLRYNRNELHELKHNVNKAAIGPLITKIKRDIGAGDDA